MNFSFYLIFFIYWLSSPTFAGKLIVSEVFGEKAADNLAYYYHLNRKEILIDFAPKIFLSDVAAALRILSSFGDPNSEHVIDIDLKNPDQLREFIINTVRYHDVELVFPFSDSRLIQPPERVGFSPHIHHPSGIYHIDVNYVFVRIGNGYITRLTDILYGNIAVRKIVGKYPRTIVEDEFKPFGRLVQNGVARSVIDCATALD